VEVWPEGRTPPRFTKLTVCYDQQTGCMFPVPIFVGTIFLVRILLCTDLTRHGLHPLQLAHCSTLASNVASLVLARGYCCLLLPLTTSGVAGTSTLYSAYESRQNTGAQKEVQNETQCVYNENGHFLFRGTRRHLLDHDENLRSRPRNNRRFW